MVTNNLPRRKIIRLKGHDYSQPGAYFITVCTKDRMHLYGEVDGEEMLVNPIGKIVEGCWNELPDHYPNVQLDGFVVMPNHVHGIIVILDEPMVGATSRRPEIGAGRPRPWEMLWRISNTKPRNVSTNSATPPARRCGNAAISTTLSATRDRSRESVNTLRRTHNGGHWTQKTETEQATTSWTHG
jgi:hypothetical protein